MDEAGKISLGLQLDNEQYKRQLKDTVKNTESTFKKTGKNIEKNMGSSLKKSFKDFNKGFAQGFSEGFKKEFKQVENDGIKTSNVLKSSFSKVGLAIAAAFSVKKLVEFGKESVQLASDLAEVDNVVSTAFPNMQKTVDEFASDSIQRIGMSEKTYKEYMGTMGLMAKSFGYTEEQALSMSKSLTDMVGDVSSIRNISFDESYNKMKAVFTGETESLKTLGVVMTQNALDQFALAKGMGKTTSEMTEQEKVALRYQFVMDKLNYAVGDFQKTSGGWANQTRMLKENFDQLKSVIGSGLISALLPVISTLNTIILKITEVAKKFSSLMKTVFGKPADDGSSKAMEAMAETSETVQDGIKGIGDQSKKTAKEVKKTVLGFDELNKLQAPEDDETDISGVEDLISAQEELNEKQEEGNKEEDTWLDKLKQRLNELKQEFKDGFNLTFNKDEFDNDLAKVKQNLQDLKTNLGEIWQGAKPAFDDMVNDVVKSAGMIAGTVAQTSMAAANGVSTGISNFVSDNKERITNDLTDIFNRAGTIATSTATLIDDVGQHLQDIFRSDNFAGYIESVMNVIYTTITQTVIVIESFIQGIITGLQQFINDRGEEFKNRIINLLGIKEDINNAIAGIRDSIGELFTFIFDNPHFANIVEEVTGIFADIALGSEELSSKLTRDIVELVDTTLKNNLDNIKKELDNALKFVDDIFKGIEDITKTFFEELNAFYDEYMEPFFDDIQKGLDTILQSWHNTWEENIAPVLERVGEKWKTFCNETFKPLMEDIKEALGSLVKEIQGLWNDVLVPLLSWLADKLGPIIGQIVERVVGFVQTAIKTIMRLIDDVILVIQGFIKVVKGIIEAFKGVVEFIKGVFTGDLDLAIQGVKDIFQGLYDFVAGIFEGIAGFISGIVDGVSGAVGAVKDLFAGKDSEKATEHKIMDAVQETTSNVNKGVRSLFGGPEKTESGITKGKSGIAKFATGGFVKQPQLAIVGDSPKSAGGEIISPIDKMAETFRSVMQEYMGQQQPIILNNYIDMDGRIIYQETKNMSYNESNRQGNRQYR